MTTTTSIQRATAERALTDSAAINGGARRETTASKKNKQAEHTNACDAAHPNPNRRGPGADLNVPAAGRSPHHDLRWAGDPDEDGASDTKEVEIGPEHDPVHTEPVGSWRGHHVMDRAEIVAALEASGFDGTYDSLSSGEEQRARTLVRYRDMPLFRQHLVGTPAMLARLDDLDRAAPNFAAVTRLVRRAAYLSLVSGAPLRVQPMVLLGSPGIGKSRYARALATDLQTSYNIVNGSTLPDVGSLTGYPPVWRGAGPGRLAKYIVSSTTSGPMIFLDEAEKVVDYERMANPLDRMLSILEPGTAASFQDENLQVPMRAQNAIILFACNTLDGLSEPFRDRVLITRINDLSPAERHAVLETMLAEVAQTLGLSISLASNEALAPLRSLSLRRCRLAFEIAIGHAVERDRRFLVAQDLAEAVKLMGSPDQQQKSIGFIQRRAALD